MTNASSSPSLAEMLSTAMESGTVLAREPVTAMWPPVGSMPNVLMEVFAMSYISSCSPLSTSSSVADTMPTRVPRGAVWLTEKWYSESVNVGNSSFTGKTVTLMEAFA